MYTHKIETIVRILFKQEFNRKLLHVCKQQFLFYICQNICYCNFKIFLCFRVTSTNCRINRVISADDEYGEVRNK
jgi:hypothetical protein